MKDLPNLRLLQTFELVNRLGSMRRAAGRLNVSLPAISKSIQNLEHDLGLALMDRSTKPATPTKAGEKLAQSIQNGLDIIADTISDLHDAQAKRDTQITLCCTIGMATHWLMPRLSGFYAAHPGITVNIQAPPTDRPDLSGQTDIALRYGRGGWNDGPTHRLFDECVCPVGRPDVIDRAIKAGDMRAVPLIDVRNDAMKNWVNWAGYCARIGLDHPKQTGETFDNYVQAVQAALDGRGLMLGWRSITQTLVHQGRLGKWPKGDQDFQTGYYISCTPNRAHIAAIQNFMTWAQQVAQTDMPPECV
jgi:DNA-binding transcriptional LysR family regulator